MNIALSAEQELLRDTVADLADTLATDDPTDIPAGERLDQHWDRIVELGLPTLRAPELCGLESTGVETAVAIEQLAARLCAAPALGQAVLVSELLQAAGAAKELELVAEGALRLAPLLTPDLSGFATARMSGVAFDAAGATHALCISVEGGCRRIAYAPLAGPPPTATDGGLDLTRTLRVSTVADAMTATTAGDSIDPERWSKVEALALTAVSADLVGVMTGALDDAVRYAGERVQFGAKIGSFQAIQHLLADSLVRLEGARSCLWHAAWAVDHLSSDEALLSARTAKAYGSAAAREVVENAMQVLGGISITWEHLSHLRLRRTLLDRRVFGDETCQFEAIAAMRLADRELG